MANLLCIIFYSHYFIISVLLYYIQYVYFVTDCGRWASGWPGWLPKKTPPQENKHCKLAIMWTILLSHKKMWKEKWNAKKWRKEKKKRISWVSIVVSFHVLCQEEKYRAFEGKQRRIKKASEKKRKGKARNQPKKPNVIRTCNNLKPLYPPILFIYVVKCVCIQYPPFIPNQNRHLFGIYYSSDPKQENTLTLFSPLSFVPPTTNFPLLLLFPLFPKFPLGTEGERRGEEKKIEKVGAVCVEGLFLIHVWELMTDTIGIHFVHKVISLKGRGKTIKSHFVLYPCLLAGLLTDFARSGFEKKGKRRRRRRRRGREETSLFFPPSPPLSTSSSKPTPPPPLPNPFFPRKKGIAFPK